MLYMSTVPAGTSTIEFMFVLTVSVLVAEWARAVASVSDVMDLNSNYM